MAACTGSPPTTPPHGYRSAVQWSDVAQAWIAAGTNGSDISRDDGHTWQPLDNGNWNALSLPFVVGPDGRIGRMDPAQNPQALTRATASRRTKRTSAPAAGAAGGNQNPKPALQIILANAL